jgi:galactose-1-phosphate uridylyltransferase
LKDNPGMPKYQNPYFTLPDGTLKHINPLTGTEVWSVPARAHRPFFNKSLRAPKLLSKPEKENFCDFCQAEYFRTPPEKARIIQTSDGNYKKLEKLNPDLLEASYATFRRVANLFEIVTIDYWVKNHGFEFSGAQSQWKRNYLDNSKGLDHVLQLVAMKLKLLGNSAEEISNLPIGEKLKLADGFFAGSHELSIAGRHYRPGAEWDNELYSSGEMTPEEHYQYLRFTIDAMMDIYSNNRYVRYVTIFQNWLQEAGASFDHLHKQLVGLDEWGTSIQAELGVVRDSPNIYNESIVNFSAYHNLVFAENDKAIALSEIGHRYPTLAIYSKSRNTRPDEHSEEELRGVSDLVHACHAAMGNQIPCNEEWYYSPRDSVQLMPWHILIKWRTVNPAGFEGGTKIFINPVSPIILRDQVVPRLYELRNQGKIRNLRIATECELKLNPLLYGKK